MLIIGIAGKELAASERAWIQHPACSGVILFSRNFASRQQVAELSQSIREATPAPRLICVDQEGGRVQRFREGYADLPSLDNFGHLYASNPAAALNLAEEHAWLMASEIRATGIDLSFAPVVDLGRGNRAIGNRAFHAEPTVVAEFTRAYIRGMHSAGMAATLKHFPGHGSVLEDTHFDDAIDPRPLNILRAEDLLPFSAGIEAGAEAVMMAHVKYPAVAPEPAGYAPRWMHTILREEMGFRGVIFSDDIGMAAAESVGGVAARIGAHLDAGCDLVLVCPPALVDDALCAMDHRLTAGFNQATLVQSTPLDLLMGRGVIEWEGLLSQSRYSNAKAVLSTIPLAV